MRLWPYAPRAAWRGDKKSCLGSGSTPLRIAVGGWPFPQFGQRRGVKECNEWYPIVRARRSLDFLNRANLDSRGLIPLDAEVLQNLDCLRQYAEAFMLLFLGYADIDVVLDVELRLPG
jgi:hypothetical protein